MWIAAAAVQGQCAKLSVGDQDPRSFKLPVGVQPLDCEPLHKSTYMKGLGGKDLTDVMYEPDLLNGGFKLNYTAALQVDAVYTTVVLFKSCASRESGAVGGVFIITLLTLLYGAWRRFQLRTKFNIDGTWQDDVLAWLFCTQCAMCQEYRTMRGAHVEDGVWGGRSGWLLDSATTMKPPPSVAMV